MDAGGIDQRKPGAAGCIVRSRAGRRLRVFVRASENTRDGVPVAQVIHRALIGGELLAVVVRGVTDQLGLAKVPHQLDCRQVVGIRAAYPLGSCRVELSLIGVRVSRPVGGFVVLVLPLVEKAGRDRDARARLPRGREARHVGVRVVDVVVDDGAGVRVDAIDPAAVITVPEARADPENAVGHRPADRDAELAIGLPVLRIGELAAYVCVRRRGAGWSHDVTHRTTLGTRAEQSALRPAQHLDALQVEGLWQGVIGVETDRAHLYRSVVDVDTGGAGAPRGGDAANRDRIGAGVIDRHPRREANHVPEVLDAPGIDRFLGQGCHADRHLAELLLAPRRGDDHFLQPLGARGRPGAGNLLSCGTRRTRSGRGLIGAGGARHRAQEPGRRQWQGNRAENGVQ